MVHLWLLWTFGLHKRRGIQWTVTDLLLNGENSVTMTESFRPPAPLATCANALTLCRIQVKWLAPKKLLSSFLGSLSQHRRYFKKLALICRCDQLSYVLGLWKLGVVFAKHKELRNIRRILITESESIPIVTLTQVTLWFGNLRRITMNLSRFYSLKQLLQEPERVEFNALSHYQRNVTNPEIKFAIHKSLSTNVIWDSRYIRDIVYVFGYL
jgi:hypothetical protein